MNDVRLLAVHFPEGGIGATLVPSSGGWTVSQVPKGSYAARLDLNIGDKLLQINKEDISSWPLEKILEELKSPKVTSISVKFRPRTRLRVEWPAGTPAGITCHTSKKAPGIKIDTVTPGSYADSLNLAAGDVMLLFNDIDISTWKIQKILAEMELLKPGYITLLKGPDATTLRRRSIANIFGSNNDISDANTSSSLTRRLSQILSFGSKSNNQESSPDSSNVGRRKSFFDRKKRGSKEQVMAPENDGTNLNRPISAVSDQESIPDQGTATA